MAASPQSGKGRKKGIRRTHLEFVHLKLDVCDRLFLDEQVAVIKAPIDDESACRILLLGLLIEMQDELLHGRIAGYEDARR